MYELSNKLLIDLLKQYELIKLNEEIYKSLLSNENMINALCSIFELSHDDFKNYVIKANHLTKMVIACIDNTIKIINVIDENQAKIIKMSIIQHENNEKITDKLFISERQYYNLRKKSAAAFINYFSGISNAFIIDATKKQSDEDNTILTACDKLKQFKDADFTDVTTLFRTKLKEQKVDLRSIKLYVDYINRISKLFRGFKDGGSDVFYLFRELINYDTNEKKLRIAYSKKLDKKMKFDTAYNCTVSYLSTLMFGVNSIAMNHNIILDGR